MYWGGFIWQLVLQFVEPPGQHGIEAGLGFRLLSAMDQSCLNLVWQPLRKTLSPAAAAAPSNPGGGGGINIAHNAIIINNNNSVTANAAADATGGWVVGSPPRPSSHLGDRSGDTSALHATTVADAGGSIKAGQPGSANSSARGGGGGAAGVANEALALPLPPAVAAKVTVSCREAATGMFSCSYLLDAMTGE
jgi:hypothetical protein